MTDSTASVASSPQKRPLPWSQQRLQLAISGGRPEEPLNPRTPLSPRPQQQPNHKDALRRYIDLSRNASSSKTASGARASPESVQSAVREYIDHMHHPPSSTASATSCQAQNAKKEQEMKLKMSSSRSQVQKWIDQAHEAKKISPRKASRNRRRETPDPVAAPSIDPVAPHLSSPSRVAETETEPLAAPQQSDPQQHHSWEEEDDDDVAAEEMTLRNEHSIEPIEASTTPRPVPPPEDLEPARSVQDRSVVADGGIQRRMKDPPFLSPECLEPDTTLDTLLVGHQQGRNIQSPPNTNNGIQEEDTQHDAESCSSSSSTTIEKINEEGVDEQQPLGELISQTAAPPDELLKLTLSPSTTVFVPVEDPDDDTTTNSRTENNIQLKLPILQHPPQLSSALADARNDSPPASPVPLTFDQLRSIPPPPPPPYVSTRPILAPEILSTSHPTTIPPSNSSLLQGCKHADLSTPEKINDDTATESQEDETNNSEEDEDNSPTDDDDSASHHISTIPNQLPPLLQPRHHRALHLALHLDDAVASRWDDWVEGLHIPHPITMRTVADWLDQARVGQVPLTAADMVTDALLAYQDEQHSTRIERGSTLFGDWLVAHIQSKLVEVDTDELRVVVTHNSTPESSMEVEMEVNGGYMGRNEEVDDPAAEPWWAVAQRFDANIATSSTQPSPVLSSPYSQMVDTEEGVAKTQSLAEAIDDFWDDHERKHERKQLQATKRTNTFARSKTMVAASSSLSTTSSPRRLLKAVSNFSEQIQTDLKLRPQPINAVSSTRNLSRPTTSGSYSNAYQWWRQPYDRRSSSREEFVSVDVNTLYSSSRIISERHELDNVPWESRSVQQQFLQSLTDRAWFGSFDLQEGNKVGLNNPVCRPKSMEMPVANYAEWPEDDGPRKAAIAALGPEYASYFDNSNDDEDDDSWAEEVPECGKLINVELKPGERISRVTPYCTSSLRRSRWRKKYCQ